MDYRKYCCNKKDRMICGAESCLAAAVISWLFYQSWYAMVMIFPIYFILRGKYQKDRAAQRKAKLLLEFRDGMQAVSAALLAGYSMENAWREAEAELKELHGEQAMITVEFHQMNAGVRMNQPLEQVLGDFAKRSGCEDIESFSEVFAFAKRGGGDFARIIQTTIQRISGKMEVEREIETVIAGKKLEGRIMNMMPVFILAYLNLTSKEFLQLLYGNTIGIFVMTGALAGYAGAMMLSERIMAIKV